MKYKVIKLEDNKSVLVDESAEIKGLYHDSFTNKLYQSNGAEYVKSNQVNNVIATINHSISLDVPMVIVEDGVEILTDEVEIITETLCTKKGDENNSIDLNAYDLAIIDGYKAAQQKGVYSKEDLIKAMEASIEWWCAEISEKYGDIEIIEDFADIFIQSLKQEYIELEMETECCKKYTSCNMNCRYDKDTVWKIKTDRINGQLMCYTKKL